MENLIEHLNSPDLDERLTALDALQAVWSPQAAEALLSLINEALVENNPNSWYRDEKLDDDEIVWSIAARILGQMNEKRATEPLKHLLNHRNDDLICEAAIALGHLHATDAVKPLISLLTYGSYYTLRICAANALGEIGSTEAVSFLIESLNDNTNDSEYEARRAVARALGEIGDKRALADLQNALRIAHEREDSITTDYFDRKSSGFEHYIEELKTAIANLQ